MHSNLDSSPTLQQADGFLGPDQRLLDDLFDRDVQGHIRFASEVTTVLCSDVPKNWAPREAEMRCQEEGGRSQASSRIGLLVFFDSPRAALTCAIKLLREQRAHPLRASISTCSLRYAEFSQSGTLRRLYFGEELARTERTLRGVVPGTLVLCPQSFRSVSPVLPTQAPEAMIATEMIGDELIHAWITLPPHSDADLSSFAGLGLV